MIYLTTNIYQLYSDMQNFRSDVKKCVTRAAVESYHLIPPEHL